MQKEFVPYELAVKLKELGFDEECLMYYEEDSKRLVHVVKGFHYDLLAPLWQQAFDWLWNKTNKYIIPIPNDDKKWLCLGIKFDTYEESRLACLEKLIEIIEDENN